MSRRVPVSIAAATDDRTVFTMAATLSLLLSYVLDWIVIVYVPALTYEVRQANRRRSVFAIIGAVFNRISPNHRAFDLADPDISFPFQPDTVSVAVLAVVALVVPAIVIPAVCLLLVPGSRAAHGASRAQLWRRKLWEWHTGWMGLALAAASAFFFTQGLKLLFGVPRPDLLARCQPDLANIAQYQVGGLGAVQSEGNGAILVTYRICTQKDAGVVNDGFMSFPSGHASCMSSYAAPVPT